MLSPRTAPYVSAAVDASRRRGPSASAVSTATPSASPFCLVPNAAASSSPAATAPRMRRIHRAAYRAATLSAMNSESTRATSNQVAVTK